MLLTGLIIQIIQSVKGVYDQNIDAEIVFLKTLAENKDGEYSAEDCVSVVCGGKSFLETAFADILKKINNPVDCIDPGFDLVDKDSNVLKLGAGGVIADSAGIEHTVRNIIGNPDSTVTALEYTP